MADNEYLLLSAFFVCAYKFKMGSFALGRNKYSHRNCLRYAFQVHLF